MTSTPGASGLWHLHSEVLGGFYQSDILVVARSRDEAIDSACEAFSDHIDAQIAERYSAFLNDCTLDPDDEDYTQSREAVSARFRAEAQAKITHLESGRMVMHSS